MANTEPTKLSPKLLILNQMAGPMTWELAEDLGETLGCVAMLTGHPDTLWKGSSRQVQLYRSLPYRRSNTLVRVLRWMAYCVHAFFWLWKWPRRTPVLVFSNPPIGMYVTWLMSLLRGTPYYVMVHDIYPDVAVRMGLARESNWLIRGWRRLNRWAYERAAGVMTLGEFMRQVLSAQFDPSKTTLQQIAVIYPWADTNRLTPLPKQDNPFVEKHDLAGKLTVIYSGNMGLGHDIESMIETARRLQDVPDIHFLFIGAGPKWELADAAGRELANVTCLPWLPEEDIPWSLTSADVAFVSLEDEMSGLAVPSKAFYSLAAGSALCVISGRECELSEIVGRYACGAVVSPNDPQAIVDVLRHWHAAPRELAECQRLALRASREIGSRRSNSAQIVRYLLDSAPVDQPDYATPVAGKSTGSVALTRIE